MAFCLCGILGWLNQPIRAQSRSLEADRQKAVSKIQFTQNFHDLQLNSQKMLREHEAGALTAALLGKATRAINKCAKTLRGLMALGDLAVAPQPIEKPINGQEKFDRAIRQLSQLVYDFAHSPVHKNSKVFDTKAATKAQIQLLTIIELSKALETQARDYPQSISQAPISQASISQVALSQVSSYQRIGPNNKTNALQNNTHVPFLCLTE